MFMHVYHGCSRIFLEEKVTSQYQSYLMIFGQTSFGNKNVLINQSCGFNQPKKGHFIQGRVAPIVSWWNMICPWFQPNVSGSAASKNTHGLQEFASCRGWLSPKFHGCFEVPKLVLWPRTFNNGCFREGTHLSGQLQPEAGKSIQKSMKKTSWASMSKNPATPVTLALSSHSCTDFLSLHAAWTACAAQEASSSLAAKKGIWLDHWGVLPKETYRKPTGNHDFPMKAVNSANFPTKSGRGGWDSQRIWKSCGVIAPHETSNESLVRHCVACWDWTSPAFLAADSPSTIDTRVSYGFKMDGFRMSWI